MSGDFTEARRDMIETQIKSRGICSSIVLKALEKVPRELFVPDRYRDEAYADHPLAIGHDQTISQPYIVTLMTDAAEIKPNDRVLEIGTGSGYQTAILAECAKQVFTIEIIDELSKSAEERLKALGYKNIHCGTGDGHDGWPEEAPFDVILVTAAAPKIPDPLIAQLRVSGRLIIPVGRYPQELQRIKKLETGIERENLLAVVFVPMTGKVRR